MCTTYKVNYSSKKGRHEIRPIKLVCNIKLIKSEKIFHSVLLKLKYTILAYMYLNNLFLILFQ